jgi:hypothetical protein
VETPDGLVRLPPGLLTRSTADRYLRQWSYDQVRLTRAPAAMRFQARRSNELWNFDLSPSDLKHVPARRGSRRRLRTRETRRRENSVGSDAGRHHQP